MKIAFAPNGTRGDIHPLLALGEACRDAGHEPLMCAPPDFEDETRSRGIAFEPVGLPVREWLGERAGAFHGGLRAHMREADEYFERCFAAQFERLPAAVRGADLLVGAGIQLAGGAIAEAMRIPYRYVAYCPGLFPSGDYGPAMLPFQGLPRWGNRLLWRATLALYEFKLRKQVDHYRAILGLGPVQSAYRYFASDRPLLAADAELAPLPADCAYDVQQTPCFHPFEGEALPPKLQAFLDAGPPPVYLGFGSMPDPDPATTTLRLLDALEPLGARALISEGWAGLGNTALPAHVMAIGPVDHAALFPRTAAVVHHGGAGTTTTAARAGVPQLLVPHVMDQFYWDRRIRALGLGPPGIPRRRLTPERLAASLAAMLGNEVLADRAREIGGRLRAHLADADPVASLLTGL